MAISPTHVFSPAMYRKAFNAMVWHVVPNKLGFTLSPSLSFPLPLCLELGKPKPLFSALLCHPPLTEVGKPLLRACSTAAVFIAAGKHYHARTHRTPSDPTSLVYLYRKKKKDVTRRSPRSGPTTIGPKTAFRP